MQEVRKKLDAIVKDTESFDRSQIPDRLFKRIKSWRWGAYGWISPVSLIVTFAWMKYIDHQIDVCKIWARDGKNKPIDGAYSLRGQDEKVTVPIFSKHDLCKGFCSDNSGMQGSRAIEKMRARGRIDRNFSLNQRTVFDLGLFAEIANDINDLSSEQALEVFKLLVTIAKEKREERRAQEVVLSTGVLESNVLKVVNDISDPELVKCVAAACLDLIYFRRGLELQGVDEHKTAADARSVKAADLRLINGDSKVQIVAEVKGRSIKIDWQNLSRAGTIYSREKSLKVFMFVFEYDLFFLDVNYQEIIASSQYKNDYERYILMISLRSLYFLALGVCGAEEKIAKKISEYISMAPSIKSSTVSEWISHQV